MVSRRVFLCSLPFVGALFRHRAPAPALRVGDMFSMKSVMQVNPPGPRELQEAINRLNNMQSEIVSYTAATCWYYDPIQDRYNFWPTKIDCDYTVRVLT